MFEEDNQYISKNFGDGYVKSTFMWGYPYIVFRKEDCFLINHKLEPIFLRYRDKPYRGDSFSYISNISKSGVFYVKSIGFFKIIENEIVKMLEYPNPPLGCTIDGIVETTFENGNIKLFIHKIFNSFEIYNFQTQEAINYDFINPYSLKTAVSQNIVYSLDQDFNPTQIGELETYYYYTITALSPDYYSIRTLNVIRGEPYQYIADSQMNELNFDSEKTCVNYEGDMNIKSIQITDDFTLEECSQGVFYNIYSNIFICYNIFWQEQETLQAQFEESFNQKDDSVNSCLGIAINQLNRTKQQYYSLKIPTRLYFKDELYIREKEGYVNDTHILASTNEWESNPLLISNLFYYRSFDNIESVRIV